MNIINHSKNYEECINPVDLKILEVLKNSKSMNDVSMNNPLYKDMILYLSDFKENMINWYDMESTSSVLLIGSNFGNILSRLKEKVRRIDIIEPSLKKAEFVSKSYNKLEDVDIHVGKLEEISFKDKFDYIIINSSLEFSRIYTNNENYASFMLEYARENLKGNGKTIIITNNKFGMKYFNGASDIYDLVKFSNITGNVAPTYKLYGKNEILDMVSIAGFERCKFFYCLPENKAINVIFTDEFMPTNETLNKYLPIYNNFDLIHFSEVQAMKGALSNKVFDIFCNSYIIECSLSQKLSNIKFVNFNNYRNPEYRLVTIIDGNKVYKKKVEDVSTKHYENVIKNITNLKNEFNFNVLERVEDGIIVSDFKEYLAMDKYLISFLNDYDYDGFIEEVKKYKNCILKNIDKTATKTNVFDKYMIDVSNYDIKKLNFIKHGYWDLTFQNMFINDGNYYIFDQEWFEEDIPVEFIMYRGLKILFSFANITGNICHDLLTRLEIAEFYDLFEVLEKKLQSKINNSKLDLIYNYKYDPLVNEKSNKDENRASKKVKRGFNNFFKSIRGAFKKKGN